MLLFFLDNPRAPDPEPIGAKIGLLSDFYNRLRVAWYSDTTPNTLTLSVLQNFGSLYLFYQGVGLHDGGVSEDDV